VTQLHSAGYRNPRTLPPGPVLVVGGGNSGFQIAEELAATRQVDLSIATRAPVLPQRLAGKDLFWWLTRLGLMRITAGSRLGRRLRARPDFIIGSTRRRLRVAGVRFRPAVAGAEGRTVRFANGGSLDASTVIWTTGYRPDYSWMHIPGVAGDGHVIHRRGVTNIPGLYFLGLPWQHSRGSALLGFVHEDAAYLAGRITSRASGSQKKLPAVTASPASSPHPQGAQDERDEEYANAGEQQVKQALHDNAHDAQRNRRDDQQ
jgi:putative flavoprotein involved in K+ transport